MGAGPRIFNPSGQKLVQQDGTAERLNALFMQTLVNSIGAISVQGPAPIADLSIPPDTHVAIAVITDSDTVVWGDAIIGSGADTVLAWYNGTDWSVVGK